MSKIHEINTVGENSADNFDTEDVSEEALLKAINMNDSLAILQNPANILGDSDDEEEEEEEPTEEEKIESMRRAMQYIGDKDDPFFEKLLNEERAEMNYIYSNMPEEAHSLPPSMLEHILRSPNNPYARWANVTVERAEV